MSQKFCLPPLGGIVITRVCLLVGWFVCYHRCDFSKSSISPIFMTFVTDVQHFAVKFREVKVKVQGQTAVLKYSSHNSSLWFEISSPHSAAQQILGYEK